MKITQKHLDNLVIEHDTLLDKIVRCWENVVDQTCKKYGMGLRMGSWWAVLGSDGEEVDDRHNQWQTAGYHELTKLLEWYRININACGPQWFENVKYCKNKKKRPPQ